MNIECFTIYKHLVSVDDLDFKNHKFINFIVPFFGTILDTSTDFTRCLEYQTAKRLKEKKKKKGQRNNESSKMVGWPDGHPVE